MAPLQKATRAAYLNPPGNASTLSSHAPLGLDRVSVGARLRGLRLTRRLSLRVLAKRSGLNINTLSLIENDHTSPSVGTLQRLSQCMEIPLAEFFRPQDAHRRVVHQKEGFRESAPLDMGCMQDLAAGMRTPGAEPLLLALERGSRSGRSPIVHTGREFIYCLEGCITYHVDDVEYVLEPGDSLCFEAYLPHQWKTSGPQAARMLMLLCPADAGDSPRDRHFAG